MGGSDLKEKRRRNSRRRVKGLLNGQTGGEASEGTGRVGYDLRGQRRAGIFQDRV